MRISYNHPCFGGCGKTVSANKKMCVACMAREIHETLNGQDIESDEDDIRRLILVESEYL